MMAIVNGFCKFRYNCLPMGMCALGDILQAKLDELLGDIKNFKTYTNRVLVLSKKIFSKYIEHLRIIFFRLRATRLKVNATKYSFWLKEITYLGYVITREGIKPDTKKVQGIMDLGRPTTMTESRVLIRMVQ